MKHFLDIQRLTLVEIERLLERANYFKDHGIAEDFSSHTVAQLFYENSTRTRVSFEMAAKNLRMRVVTIEASTSSEKKGETLDDTILNLRAMGIRYFVIRHSMDYLPHRLAERLRQHDVQFINAGDGKHAHPSQAMLDAMTILAHKPDFSSLKVALIGNIRHSRVANSLQQVLAKLGCGELVMAAPVIWQPEKVYFGRVTSVLSEALENADVVMGLRVQRERLNAGEELEFEQYRREYAITSGRMKQAKHDAIVMHPGPVNRGVEMDSDVVDSAASKILEQVRYGVCMRMAILEALT